MTIDEMLDVIDDYCRGKSCTDEECGICMLCDSCHGHFRNNPVELKQAVDYIMTINRDKSKTDTSLATAVEKAVTDMINHPSHYTAHGMECIDEMQLIFGREATMHFCLLNAWKYRKRALYKNGQEDMDKSDWYIAKYKELKENEQLY